MNTFLTILAVMFGLISLARIIGICVTIYRHPNEIAVAEYLGRNPVGNAAKLPILTLIVCLAWVASRIWG